MPDIARGPICALRWRLWLLAGTPRAPILSVSPSSAGPSAGPSAGSAVIVAVVAATSTQPLLRHSAPLYYHLQTYLTTSTIDTILRKRPRIQHNRRHLWPILCRHLLPKLRRSTCPKHTRHGPREKSQVFKYLSGIKDSSVDNVDLNLTKYLNGPTTPNERNKVSTVKGV